MQVRFVLDESVDNNIVQKIRENFKGAIVISRDYPGIKDIEVIEIAQKSKSVIITEDKDFGEWVFAHNIRNISVILLRYDKKDRKTILSNILKLIKDNTVNLYGKYIVIRKDKIRIRDLIE